MYAAAYDLYNEGKFDEALPIFLHLIVVNHLDKRYYDVQVEELAALLLASSGSVKHRAMAALTKVLGLEETRQFLREVHESKSIEDLFL